MNNLPKHWQVKRLGDVCIYSKGKKPAVLKNERTEHTAIPYINIKAFEKGVFDEFTDGTKCNLCQDGDLLMVWDGARCGLTGKAKKGAVGSTLMKIEPGEGVEKEFLFYFLRSKYHTLNTRPKGVGIPHIEPTLLWNFTIPLPPLPEQHAIVARIEALFSELDKGREQLRAALQQLKVYRQSVLKWAFEGKLTRKEVQDGGLPEGWRWVKSGEIIEKINNGYTPIKQHLQEGKGEVPFIKVYNLNFDGTLNFQKNPTFIPRVIHEKDLKRSICYPNDVLINIVGPPLGKVSVVSNQFPEWNINQAIVLFRPNEKISSKYLSYFLQNPATINWLENTSKATAGQWNVKVSTCREIPIPLPPLEEQHLIVQELERRLTVCDKMEEAIREGLRQAESLRQSILKRAFEGRLVAYSGSEVTSTARKQQQEAGGVISPQETETSNNVFR